MPTVEFSAKHASLPWEIPWWWHFPGPSKFWMTTANFSQWPSNGHYALLETDLLWFETGPRLEHFFVYPLTMVPHISFHTWIVFEQVWDIRKGKTPIMVEERCHDFISCLAIDSNGKYLFATSGDGTMSTFNIKRRKFMVQSENAEHDMSCVSVVKVIWLLFWGLVRICDKFFWLAQLQVIIVIACCTKQITLLSYCLDLLNILHNVLWNQSNHHSCFKFYRPIHWINSQRFQPLKHVWIMTMTDIFMLICQSIDSRLNSGAWDYIRQTCLSCGCALCTLCSGTANQQSDLKLCYGLTVYCLCIY